MKKISFIAPCYNEELVIEEYYGRLCKLSENYKDYEFEFIIVDDGSVDSSAQILDGIASKDYRLAVLHLAANVGHQNALFAGIEIATGDINITIDIDLQDPPELLEKFIAKIEQGFDVVHAQRISRQDETIFKKVSARFFYRFMSLTSTAKLIEDCGDFRAFTKIVRESIIRYKEKHKYLRGIFSTIGFKQSIVKYKREGRHAGSTKYTLRKMLALATDATLNFSRFPIRLMFVISTLMWSLSLIYLLKALISKFMFDATVDGWTSIIFFQVFFSGVLLFFIALIGSYVGRIYEQGQDRPNYIIHYTVNVNDRKDNENI